MMETPLLRPSEGDQDKSPAIFTVVTVFFVMEVTAVALRMITRRFLTKRIGWDDWFCLGALVSSGLLPGTLKRHSQTCNR